MKALYLPCAVGLVLLLVSGGTAQTSSAKATPPKAKQSQSAVKTKLPEWKALVEQAGTARKQGNASKARALLEKAYRVAPAGQEKAQVAFEIAALCEQQKAYDEARRWYLESIFAAPKGPLTTQARQKMRELPDSRRPTAAGATSIGGGTRPQKSR